MMKYLELLKSKSMHPDALPKVTKGVSVSYGSDHSRAFLKNNPQKEGFDSFGSDPSRVFLKNNLPKGCPLDGSPFPENCRFDRKLFYRLLDEGVLPDANNSCPILRVCELYKSIKTEV